MGVPGGLVANALILSLVAAYALLARLDGDLFYRSVQEDEWLEWATVWSFLAGTLFFARAAAAQARARPIPWFLAGLALFCLWVAMEEISWGQRLVGYRPPAYFLEHNYQQEFNLHNVLEKDLRKLGLKVVLLGYGVLLPLLTLHSATHRLLRRLAIEAPPLELLPAFLATYAVYEVYPLRFSGEIVEAMMGLGFAISGLAIRHGLVADGSAVTPVAVPPRSIAITAAAIAALGLANTLHTQRVRAASPEAIAAAQVELNALGADFLREARRPGTRLFRRCGLHKRLFTARERYQWDFLSSGSFAGLVAEGMPQERADFLLDPWNYPYWIRDNCDDPKRRTVFVYSFGPNRLRDSNRTRVRGDDLGSVLIGAAVLPQQDPFGSGAGAQ